MIDNLMTYENLIGDIDRDLIMSVEALQKAKILDVMSPFLVFEDVPDELNYVLVELTIYRFNKIGSEGMSQESKTAGSEIYDTKYEDKLLEKCINYAKNKAAYSSKWEVKLL